jgi:hypothetical protein
VEAAQIHLHHDEAGHRVHSDKPKVAQIILEDFLNNIPLPTNLIDEDIIVSIDLVYLIELQAIF